MFPCTSDPFTAIAAVIILFSWQRVEYLLQYAYKIQGYRYGLLRSFVDVVWIVAQAVLAVVGVVITSKMWNEIINSPIPHP